MRATPKSLMLVCTVLLAGGIALAQDQAKAPKPAGTPSEEMITQWNDVNGKIVAMAKDFPEDKFDFKVQKDQRTFAQNVLHVAGADYEFMTAIAGKRMGPEIKDIENPSREAYRTKAAVVALIEHATTDGAALIKSQGDARLNETMKNPFANSMAHVSSIWIEAIEHAGEHYGQLVVYYRANGLVPPESRPQPK